MGCAASSSDDVPPPPDNLYFEIKSRGLEEEPVTAQDIAMEQEGGILLLGGYDEQSEILSSVELYTGCDVSSDHNIPPLPQVTFPCTSVQCNAELVPIPCYGYYNLGLHQT